MNSAPQGRNVAGVIPLSGWHDSFDFPWPDYLQPLREGFLAVERSVYECAYAGCKTIWVVVDDEWQPVIRERLGEFIPDPATLGKAAFTRFPSEHYKYIPIFYVPIAPKDKDKRESMIRSLNYMGLQPNKKITDIKVDRIFIGSCTNGRIGDLREAAKIIKGKKVANHVNAMVVPGSGLVKQQAEQEGIDKIFKEAGFDWREPGCSMCLAMNADKLNPKERCASTSNRNFEGRQGRGGRTHLLSPAMAAAAAIDGHLTDVRKFNN